MIEGYKWYVVHTYSGYEKKVKDSIEKLVLNRGLQDQIVEVMIPMEKVDDKSADKNKTDEYDDSQDSENNDAQDSGNGKKRAKKKVTERMMFPGYVLVKLAVSFHEKKQENRMTDEIWYVIRNTRGVTGFVGPEGNPVPLTEEEVCKLGVEQRSVSVDYEVGDLVTVIHGSFDGFSGIVDKIDLENDTVRVIISMMGRDTPLELGLDQVESSVD